MKKLRINVEGRVYEVEVDVLGANGSNGSLPDLEAPPLPESVLRKRPPHRLPEDSVGLCPMSGRVIEVYAAAGKEVQRNEPVVLLEAMKMQIPIGPAVDGVIKAINVAAGDMVAAGQVLFELA